MNNQPNLPTAQKTKFSVAITTPGYKKLIANTLTDPKRQSRFIASITSAVGINPALQDCDSRSIIAGALLGESLNLSPSPQLGQYYLVPFKQKEKRDRQGNILEPECSKATFILGYKGMIQLAIRSGYYKKINVLEIKNGELIEFDPLNEEISVKLETDPDVREGLPTIGYYVMFEYMNGFRKAMYWTHSKMMRHADTYAPAFSATEYEKLMRGEIAERDRWKYSSFWYTSFDDMAKKTMLRQLISHWGVMSAEMANAFEADERAMKFEGNDIVPDLVDADPVLPEGNATDATTAGDEPEVVSLGDLG